jgi:RimJ/RimL family protein N-acetyltransferase
VDAPVELRPLAADDWEALRDLRLYALRTEIGKFFKHPDEEAGRPQSEWRELATGDESHQLFGLFAGRRLVGMSGVFASRDDPSGTSAHFGMSYILPEYRGLGLSARFYEARLAWVLARPHFRRIGIGHRKSNEASRRAIERFGFVFTREEMHHWPDGTDEPDVCYERIIS